MKKAILILALLVSGVWKSEAIQIDFAGGTSGASANVYSGINLSGWIFDDGVEYIDGAGAVTTYNLFGFFEIAPDGNYISIDFAASTSGVGGMYIVSKNPDGIHSSYNFAQFAENFESLLTGPVIGVMFVGSGNMSVSIDSITTESRHVPDGGTTATLLGLSVLGLAFARRHISSLS